MVHIKEGTFGHTQIQRIVVHISEKKKEDRGSYYVHNI